MSRRVETYSGYRADERLTRFCYKGQTVEVQRIISHWREPDADCFRVIGDDGRLYELRQEQGHWAVKRDNLSIHPVRKTD